MQDHMENRVYAGFFVRLVAFAIDSLIAGLVVGMVKLPFSFAAMGGVKFLKANLLFDYSFLDMLGYVGVAAYFVVLTYLAHATPGKKLMRIQVITKTGEWTFINVLYRETIGRFLSSLLCIGYLAVLVQSEKQGFHDMLCDTYVVYKDMCPQGKERKMVPVMAGTAQADILVEETVAGQTNETESVVDLEQQGDLVTDNAKEVKPVIQRPEAPVYYSMPAAGESTDEEPTVPNSTYDGMNPDSSNLGNLS